MNVYNAEDIKKAIPIARYFRDQGVPLSSGDRRAAAVWREVDMLAKLIEDLRSQRDMWYDKVEELRTALQKN